MCSCASLKCVHCHTRSRMLSLVVASIELSYVHKVELANSQSRNHRRSIHAAAVCFKFNNMQRYSMSLACSGHMQLVDVA